MDKKDEYEYTVTINNLLSTTNKAENIDTSECGILQPDVYYESMTQHSIWEGAISTSHAVDDLAYDISTVSALTGITDSDDERVEVDSSVVALGLDTNGGVDGPTLRLLDVVSNPFLKDNERFPMKVALLSRTPNAKRVAFAAIRSCYSSDNAVWLFNYGFDEYEAKKPKDGGSGSDADRLIRMIKGSGHTSTLEHISFTFAVECVSRALLAQLTRHRVGWSYSVQSQRYVRMDSVKHDGFGFVDPTLEYVKDEAKDEAGRIIGDMVNAAQDAYDALTKLGVKSEDARSVLPMNATCNLVVTCNLRSFLDFYGKRGPGTHAQAEIQCLAEMMRELIEDAEPWIGELIGA